ncbi:MAG: PAS domain-containing protein [Alphaproteobacteria bacterium]|nr:PAS domain-containing protein [Alphaproteobacteria bacterium]
MNMDYREFIARHHKIIQTPQARPKPRSRYLVGFSAVLILTYAAVMLAVISFAKVENASLFVALTAVFLAALLAFVAHRFYSQHKEQMRELDLLREVLQGSRGARLITDSSDNTVYTNQKFDDLCKGLGPPGLKALVKLFENNEEALSHFGLLADQAHRGLTDSIELFSKFEDLDRWFAVTAQPVSGWAGTIHWRIDDVTEKYTVDRAIREEREKLIDFTDNAPVGFFSVDEQGRFVFANATFARWVGDDIQTLLTTTHLHTYLVDPPQSARPFDIIENGGARQVAELRMKGPAGRTFQAAINQAVVQEADGRVRTRAL